MTIDETKVTARGTWQVRKHNDSDPDDTNDEVITFDDDGELITDEAVIADLSDQTKRVISEKSEVSPRHPWGEQETP